MGGVRRKGEGVEAGDHDRVAGIVIAGAFEVVSELGQRIDEREHVGDDEVQVRLGLEVGELRDELRVEPDDHHPIIMTPTAYAVNYMSAGANPSFPRHAHSIRTAYEYPTTPSPTSPLFTMPRPLS